MSSELSYEASDEASENELLDRSLSVWRGWSPIELEDFTPITLDLHTACSIGQFEYVRSITTRCDSSLLDRKNLGGWTPLMYACYIGHDSIVNLLIHAGCNLNMKNPRGHSPLMLAASCGNETVARTLVRKGADLELVDRSGWTALFHATYAGHQNFVAFLLEAGANKDAIEPSTGMTPFMEAAAEGHEIIVQLFLQNGVNALAKAYNGDMARSLALINGYMKIVSLIDNHLMPASCVRTEPGLDLYLSSSDEASAGRPPHIAGRNLRGKSRGPSIRDGPEAIARMIDRTRNSDMGGVPSYMIPRGYVSFAGGGGEEREQTKLSYRDVTSPINPDDYKDSSSTKDFDDYNDESNAFTKTGAITIKSSSSSSGGLIAALGLSREGSVDSDESTSYRQTQGLADVAAEGDERKITLKNKDLCQKGTRDGLALEGDNPYISSPGTDLSPVAPQNLGEAKSPLAEYFPLEMSFPVGTDAEREKGKDVSQTGKGENVKEKTSEKQTLPKENMTQAEIVNKFLRNMTLEESEKSSVIPHSPWSKEQGRKAVEGELSSPDKGGCLPQSLERSGFLSSSGGSEGSRPVLSVHPVRQERSLHQGVAGQIGSGPASFPPLNYPPSLHHSQQSSGLVAPRSFHPPLNHHHPLHSRHHHHHQHHQHHQQQLQQFHQHGINTGTANQQGQFLSHLPGGSFPPQLGYTPHGTQSGPALALPHNIPQHLYYGRPEHEADLPSLPSFPAAVQHNTNFSPAQQQSRPTNIAPEPQDTNPLAHLINPALNPNPSPSFPLESPNLQQPRNVAQAPPLSTQSGAFIAQHPRDNTSEAGGNMNPPLTQQDSSSAVSNQNRQPSSAFNIQQDLPVARAAPYSVPPSINPSQSPSTASSVIIPGHVTSQPVASSAIGWLGQGGRSQPSVVSGPQDLAEMLNQLGLSKYLDKFEEQDVDLQVFLSLTDNDLKELGIKLFGPRKKMTNAIARWHSQAPVSSGGLEQAYADKLESEMQEMAIQLKQVYEKEERLKAQVRQEQQLRSVTEGCLMEERARWEQAGQLLRDMRSKMRTMGELLSRLRHHQKELKKQMGAVGSRTQQEPASRESVSTQPANLDGQPASSQDKPVSSSPLEGLLRKSEKCINEIQVLFSGILLGADHVLKSTHVMGSMDKEIT